MCVVVVSVDPLVRDISANESFTNGLRLALGIYVDASSVYNGTARIPASPRKSTTTHKDGDVLLPCARHETRVQDVIVISPRVLVNN